MRSLRMNMGWRDPLRQPPVAIEGHGRRCGIEEENVRMGECGVNIPPPSGARKGAFHAIFLSRTCFPRRSPRRGAPALATPPPFARGSTRVLARFPTFHEPTGRRPGSNQACDDWVEWCGELLVESGEIAGEAFFSLGRHRKNSRGARGIGLAPLAADRISPFFDDRAVRPPLPMRLPP